MRRKTVHFVTRLPLVANSRVLKQADSLHRNGYSVTMVGVQRGRLPAREQRNGVEILRVPHDPIPRRLSLWLRRGGLSPATSVATTINGTRRGARAQGLALRGVARAGALPWLVQSLAFYVRTVLLLGRQRPSPRTVHAANLNSLLPAVLIARRYRVPLVYDAGELYTDIHVLPSSYRRLLRLQERLLLRWVDRLLVVNPLIGEVYQQRYGRRPDAVVLNCPVYRPVPAQPDRSGIRSFHGLAADVPVIVFTGGLLPHRGLEQTVLALHELPGAVLVLLGDGEMRHAIESLAKREGLAGRVRLSGYVPHDEVSSFIASADIGIVPYQPTGLNHVLSSPSKLFHYLMAGLPVAGSDLPFLRRLILEERVGTVFDAARPSSIARAVGDVLADAASYRARLPEVARRYSWESQERAFLAVYR